jgi:hypothetical protein
MRVSNGRSIRFKLLCIAVAVTGVVLVYQATEKSIELYYILYDNNKTMEVYAGTPTI